MRTVKIDKHTEYEFTDKQEEAIGQLVVDCWGGHCQTGFTHEDFADELSGDHVPYLYTQMGPNHKIKRALIYPDGTVVFSQ